LPRTICLAHCGERGGAWSLGTDCEREVGQATSSNRAPTAGGDSGRKDQPEPTITRSDDRTTGPMFQEGSTLASYKLYVGCIVL
jgi:hypothetical protein